MTEIDKKKFTRWSREKHLTMYLGRKPIGIRAKDKRTVTVEVDTLKLSGLMSTLEVLENYRVVTKENEVQNVSKGLVYMYEYNMTDADAFKKGIQEMCGIKEAVKATWIKAKK